MQGRVVFLLEEPSMKALLKELLPRLYPHWKENTHFLLITHQGKSDLDKSIPIKLKAWQYPNDRFIILRDNDNANSIALKSKIIEQCKSANRPDTLIRLVCQELESWYLGDLAALSQAFQNPKLDSPKLAKRFAAPDAWQKPSHEIARLVPEFQKISGGRRMGAALRLHNEITAVQNNSKSFQVFISGLHRIEQEMSNE